METTRHNDSPPANAGLVCRQRSRLLRLLRDNVGVRNRLLLLLVMFFAALPSVKAESYITELKILSRGSEGDIKKVKESYQNQGWTIVQQDLNQEAGGKWIYLAYKTSDSADPNTGYVTDIIASTNNKSSFSKWNRTWYQIPHDGGNGDLNEGADGEFIYLYYTRERTNLSGHYGTKRVLNKLATSENTNSSDGNGNENYGPVYWCETFSGPCDLNKGAGGKFIYLRLYFKEQTLVIKNHPEFYEDLVYNGKDQGLLKTTPSNYGTMEYSVDGGSWTTSPTAKTVGSHTVKYRLNGGSYANNSAESSKTVTISPPTAQPSSLNGNFNQEARGVQLTWTVGSIAGDYTNYKWVVYRGEEKLGTVSSNAPRTFTDTGFENETEYIYYVYYVSNTWNEDTKKDKCCLSVKVNTTREVPVKDLTADSQSDRIVFTWTSDKYPKGWGNIFNIYVDKETDPIATITPEGKDGEVFQWEHRSTDQHADRQSKIDPKTGVYYVEEPLSACLPHSYRIVGVIDGKEFEDASVSNKAVNSGTRIYEFETSKGSYPGIVKLSWHVDVLSNPGSKTYVIQRKRAEKNEEWTTLQRMTSADEYVFFTDETPLPGVFYDYQLSLVDKCDNGQEITTELTNIGFAQTTGTMSGRITYGTSGVAVADVDVVAKKTGDSADDESQYHAIRFTADNGTVSWLYPSVNYARDKFNGGDFSMQLWILPEAFRDVWFARFRKSSPACGLSMFNTGQLDFFDGSDNYPFNLYLTKNEYNHVTLTRQGNTLTCYLVVLDGDGNAKVTKDTQTLNGNLDLGDTGEFNLGYFKGYVDEFRLWTKCLTEDEIKRNYDRLLVGNEKNLETYWTFDEGLNSQFFDYSRDGTVYNNHHGKIGSNAKPDTRTPERLALKAKTDVDGNYIIQGVPFSGEGTTYAVIPQLGIHEFNPTQQLRYVSSNSLVHNNTNFEDISSFPVSGYVHYAGTDFPVEGVTLYVDGSVCSRNGEIIQTDANGVFEINVPIGDHFITVAKSGHVFAKGGRFPEDPSGLNENKEPFNGKVTNLEFSDETLVNFTGRIVGGSIQGDKPVGFGLSNNNIGVTELVLTPSGNGNYRMNVDVQKKEGVIDIQNNKDDVPVASATERINSNSVRKGGKTIADCQKIVIQTDPETGEFSAMLPPIKYDISSMTVMKNSAIDFGDLQVVDLSNPNIVLADTLYDESRENYPLYENNTCLKLIYHSKPTFSVRQHGRTDGSCGISSYKYSDEVSEQTIDDIYTAENGLVTYNYGVDGHKAPLFVMKDNYTFLLEGYEEYVNADNGQADHVPLAGSIVTISNALSSAQSVYVESGTVNGENVEPGQVVDLKSNQLQLDDEGKATYKWKAGLPNIAEPYTRTISMTYDIDGRTHEWVGNGMEGIVLGELGTGNNFVTTGPQKLEMILRDPPGTNSFAEWKKGSATTSTTVLGNTMVENFSAGVKHRFGFKQNIIIGTPAAGTLEEIESKDDLEVGAKMESELEDSKTYVSTTTVTQTISTSAAPEYVGAQGDVYVGRSTNLVFGKARNVGFQRQSDNSMKIGLEDITTTSMDFGTMFMYTQNYIENVLIPNYELLRNSLITTTDQATIDSYTNNTDHYVYLTTLGKDDPHFGETGTFKTFEPDPMNVSGTANDNVLTYNTEIENWHEFIAGNEEAKVNAFDKRKDYLIGDNISFDSGTSYSYEVEVADENTTTREWSVKAGLVVDNTFGLNIKGFGLEVHLQDETMGGRHEVHSDGTTETTTFSYTLAEDGDDDALSVDVLGYDGFGPIFHTRGGQTCCPYEGEERTKYYVDDKGNHPVIMEATMQIEVPQINVDVPILSDIPTGGTADYTLRLSNASDIDEDVYYRLLVDDESNPDGANLTIDGKPVTDSRVIKIPAGQTVTKALQLKQTNTSILDYEDIALVLASQCQFDPTSTWDVIADTVKISAHFVPSSSEVDLALSNTLMNTETGSDLTLTFSGFNRNYRGLKAFRLQYMPQGAADWIQFHEYVVNTADVTTNNEILPATGASVSYTLPMAQFNDGSYLFRVVSASTYGTSEVYCYSDEIALTKDMQRPTPLGLPEPSDGILEAGEDVGLTFNENVVKGALTKTANFKLTGILNGSPVAHETALRATGGESPTAQTEAGVTLSGKDFAIDMWVNVQGAGTLLSHGIGTSKMTIATDDQAHLIVTLGNDTYTAQGDGQSPAPTIPTDKWVFLTVSYQQADDGGKLSAAVAADSETIHFFNDKPVAKYDGDGPLAVGKGLNGAIHELLLWDEAHDLTTALADRSVTKSPSTRHLIGYWKMNEGEGTTIRDYARNRHMTMPTENWYLNNENIGVTLDGEHRISIEASALQLLPNDDYALEFWMRGEKQQAEAQLLQMGDIALWVNTDGQLQLNGKNAYAPDADATAMSTSAGNILDNAWHHIALSVLRQGAAAVYVDGKRVLTTNAANVGTINTNQLIVGAKRTSVMSDEIGQYAFERPFKGTIDELRLWSASMNADLLAKQRKMRLTGTEDGLMAYFPFEKKTIDSYSQIVTDGNDEDLTGTGIKAQLIPLTIVAPSAAGGDVTPTYSPDAPALRTKPVETNVGFSFTASDNKIVITVDEDPATIEGCTLNFTVRDVSDLNGNYSLPTTWSAFVNCKQLVWKDDELAVEQPANTSSTMSATIVNKGGSMQMWTLSGMPAWLQASAESGTTNPLAETKVTFTVTESTPIGKYEETIYLTSTDGIETPLTIRVTVKGKEPDWAVNENDFEGSMILIGTLEILGVPSEDSDDIVAAFVDGECRGLARPEYNQRYDRHLLSMDIYGNNDELDKDVTFKAYDASTGVTYPVIVTSEDVNFQVDRMYGKPAVPVILSAVDIQEQFTALAKGWNWLSLNVTLDEMTVPVVFKDLSASTALVKNKKISMMNYDGTWYGQSIGLNNSEMYKVQMSQADNLHIMGKKVDPQATPITLVAGWNWVAYNGSQTISITDAMADMDPRDGDVVKGQRGTAMYDGYEWFGGLKSLVPGQGYMIQTTDARTFRYPKAVSAAGARMMTSYDEAPSHFTPVDCHLYPSNMTVVAQVLVNGVPAAGIEVGVFDKEECRAAAVTDADGLAVLTIPGDGHATMTFRVYDGSLTAACNETLPYENDAIQGSRRSPFIVSVSPTGIETLTQQDSDSMLYDLQGRRVYRQAEGVQRSTLKKGVYIEDGQKRVKK